MERSEHLVILTKWQFRTLQFVSLALFLWANSSMYRVTFVLSLFPVHDKQQKCGKNCELFIALCVTGMCRHVFQNETLLNFDDRSIDFKESGSTLAKMSSWKALFSRCNPMQLSQFTVKIRQVDNSHERKKFFLCRIWSTSERQCTEEGRLRKNFMQAAQTAAFDGPSFQHKRDQRQVRREKGTKSRLRTRALTKKGVEESQTAQWQLGKTVHSTNLKFCSWDMWKTPQPTLEFCCLRQTDRMEKP